MLSRNLTNLSRASCGGLAAARKSALQMPSSSILRRNYIGIIEPCETEEEMNRQVAVFAFSAQSMGCEPMPYYRKERLTGANKRAMYNNKKIRARSFAKVLGLAEMISLQNDYKLR